MIRGYFRNVGTSRRPFVDGRFLFTGMAVVLEAPLLVDTGADRTIISSFDAGRLSSLLGVDFSTFPTGAPTVGVGGLMGTRLVEATLDLQSASIPLRLTVLEPSPRPSIPSLLGRDVISRFALIIEDRMNRVLLLDSDEADALNLP
jgi:hypothetical protein